MNTNNNVYTIVYTTVVCVLVAAVLAFASQKLKPMQEANEKAETISQILTAAQFAEKDELGAWGNAKVIEFFKDNINKAVLVNAQGEIVKSLDTKKAEVWGTSQLKAQKYGFPEGKYEIPVYIFNNGVSVLPVYGQGLWGPVWGYIALGSDLKTIVGAYFDHASETPGLGGKIKDDPSFRAQFVGKSIDLEKAKAFEIVKGGAPQGQSNAIDAISGATMTSNGLSGAINEWLGAYKNYIEAQNN